MQAVAKIDRTQIEEMELSITFRMKVREWRSIMGQQAVVFPSHVLGLRIERVLKHIDNSTEMAFYDPPPKQTDDILPGSGPLMPICTS